MVDRKSPTVFVVDDDPAIRKSLRWLIESVGVQVDVFESASAFMERVTPDQPGCAVLDVRMPGRSGLDLQEWMKQEKYTLPIIIITGHADVPMAVRAMKNGALDFIEKPFSDQVLLDRIQHAIEVDRRQRAEKDTLSDIQACVEQLTPRERQVMDLVVQGRANKQVAAELGLSEKTVEVHRAHVMSKMKARSVADLVRMALAAAREADDAT